MNESSRRVPSAIALSILLVLVAACSSNGATDGPEAAGGADRPERDNSALLGAAEEGLAESGISGPFYELTLLEYVDIDADDPHDHTAFLPDTAELVFSAEVERQLQGETDWDVVEVVRYPDPATYLETIGSSAYAAAEAGRSENIADHHVALTEPVTPISGDPLVAGEEPALGAPPAASDDPDDPPFMLVAAVEVVDQEALDRHYAGASAGGGESGAAGLGVRPVQWMDVAATLVGTEDKIDSVRFNHWPSHSAFEETMAGDPDTGNREEGLGAASTMMTLPAVDQFTVDANEVAPIDLSEEELAALYSPAAMDFLDASVGFSSCLEEAGWAWTGEPAPDDPDVDPGYLAALGQCSGDLDIEAALVRLFGEAPGVAPVADVPEAYRSDAAVEALVAVDTFVSCLGEAGFEWSGLDGDGGTGGNDTTGYQAALASCSGQAGIQAALDALLE